MSARSDPLLHIARVRDDLVVLDLRVGAYDLAPGAFTDAHDAAEVRSRLADILPAAAAPPLELIDNQGAAGRRDPLKGLAAGEVVITLRDRWDFALSYAAVALSYPRRSLRRLVATEAPSPRGSQAQVLRRAAVFARLLPWAPFPGACLWRAYFLRRFLRRGGCDAAWVFGVRTWPFRAHCWLEAEDVVLNDDPRAVWPYTPILRA